MSISQISLPKGVGPHAEKLFDAITQAGTAEASVSYTHLTLPTICSV